jgi:hypothetical protein
MNRDEGSIPFTRSIVNDSLVHPQTTALMSKRCLQFRANWMNLAAIN